MAAYERAQGTADRYFASGYKPAEGDDATDLDPVVYAAKALEAALSRYKPETADGARHQQMRSYLDVLTAKAEGAASAAVGVQGGLKRHAIAAALEARALADLDLNATPADLAAADTPLALDALVDADGSVDAADESEDNTDRGAS